MKPLTTQYVGSRLLQNATAASSVQNDRLLPRQVGQFHNGCAIGWRQKTWKNKGYIKRRRTYSPITYTPARTPAYPRMCACTRGGGCNRSMGLRACPFSHSRNK